MLCFQCVFLTWCMAPIASNGSQMIYHRLIKPVVLKYQGDIDNALDKAADKLHEGENKMAGFF